MAQFSTQISRRALLAGLGVAPLLPRMAQAHLPSDLIEPHMHLLAPLSGPPTVALTFDACDGHTDHRILDLLLTEEIPATIFVSGLWLRRNGPDFARLLSRPDLFEIGDHGLHHHAAIDRDLRLWGVPSAGSPQGVATEVTGGTELILKAGGPRPRWFRGATALYTQSAMTEIRALGYRIAGFSINGDQGASLGATEVRRRYLSAAAGDVLISHINQPHRPAGNGVVAGIHALRSRGYRFVRLSEPGVQVSRAATDLQLG
ncbi:polysaccharide deacetylase [Thioclava sp. BHET1]|nr:polysaccharide deacetylase [Thioclava sp. BHET1]